MANSFSQELEDLLNPLPKFADPEDDHDEATKARVSDTFAEADDEAAAVNGGALRRRNAGLLADSDPRYLGKAVSRHQLFMDMDVDVDVEPHSDDDDDDDQDDDRNQEDDDEEDGSVEELEDEEEEADEEEEEEAGAGISPPARADLHKLTDGPDEPSASEDEGGPEGETQEDEDGTEVEEDEGLEGAISTFSKAKEDEEVEKGRAVRNQLAVWERLLEARIKMQKALASANRLPQPHILPHFVARGGAQLAGSLKNARKALKALQRSLLDLHHQLARQSAAQVLSSLHEEHDNRAGPAPKRKLDMSDYHEVASKRFAAFRPYRNATLQKWHDKTRLSSGKNSNFGALERDAVTQVEQILMDKERLVRRTQTPRSEYRVLGSSEEPSGERGARDHSVRPTPPSKPSDEAEEDIFDDDDFYHQLLRELIERKTGGADANRQVAAGRQWLQIQKLRGKLKKKVDTKASKGRKVRFDVHAKLLNFMAPVLRDREAMPHDARTELYRALFGFRPSADDDPVQ